MEYDCDDDRYRRGIGANLITSWVLAAMLLMLSAFLAQFPESGGTRPAAAADRR